MMLMSIGPGRGPINQNSRQVYALASMTLQIKKAPLLGAGKSVWNNVHIHDLGNLFVLLTEAAVAGRHDDGLWGADGYYLVENGEHVWGDVSRSIAEIAAKEGYIPAPTVETVDIETCEKFAGYQALSWGMNSRGKARRAARLLGWKPVAPSLEEELPGIVKLEYNDLKN